MQICKAGGDEETEDVVVDGDDTATFGPTQFNENDIQSAAADHSSHEEGNKDRGRFFFLYRTFNSYIYYYFYRHCKKREGGKHGVQGD